MPILKVMVHHRELSHAELRQGPRNLRDSWSSIKMILMSKLPGKNIIRNLARAVQKCNRLQTNRFNGSIVLSPKYLREYK